MPNCSKCGQACGKKEIRTIYALGIPKKVCPKCERLYHILPLSLRKIYAETKLPISTSFGNSFCRVCGQDSNGGYPLRYSGRYSRNTTNWFILCKRCASKLKDKIVTEAVRVTGGRGRRW